MKEHAVYANQWRFRSCCNEIHTAEYFFNNGNLDADEILRQLIHVTTNYENISIQIHGVCSDAGGSNEGLFSALRLCSILEDSSVILSANQVSFKNPIYPDRLIWLWHCSTHNCKNARNNLWRSVGNPTPATKKQKRGKKLMLFEDQVVFGWEQIEATYARQNKSRLELKLAPRGKGELCYQSVHLDGLTLMNASYAKSPFSNTTLSQLSTYCAGQLCHDLNTTTEKRDITVYCRFMGYAKEFRSALSDIKTEKGKLTFEQKEVLATVCILEYNTVMYSIFNERFLNAKWFLTLKNIDDEEKELKKSLQFICNWMMEKQQFLNQHPLLKNKAWEPHLLASKTYKNIRIGINGYLGYAKQVLQLDGIYFVPGLHSNQSILEAYFSSLRFHHHDTAAKMGRSAIADNVRRTITNGPGFLLLVKQSKERRKLTYESWNKILANRIERQRPISFMKATNIEPQTTFSAIVKTGLEGRLLHGGFINLLLSDPIFAGFSKAIYREEA